MDTNWLMLYVGAGAYTLYVLLCGVALWSTFQESWSSRTRMRVPLAVMLVVLTVAFILNTVGCYLRTDENASRDGPVPKRIHILQLVSNVMTCLAGTLSDGLLAWRCFVLFGKRPWMKWVLVAMITSDFILGSLSNIALGAQLRLDDGLIQHYFYLEQVKASLINSVTAQKLIDVWAWIYFAMNTTMTVSIIYKIFSSTHRSKTLVGPHIYSTVVRAVIESSLITWMGLLACAITSTDFLVHVQIPDATLVPLTDLGGGVEIAYTYAFMLLPFIFGISQSLIIARIGFSRLRAPSLAAKRTAIVFASNSRTVDEEKSGNTMSDTIKCGDTIEVGNKCSLSGSSI